jgi:hypothetical protein
MSAMVVASDVATPIILGATGNIQGSLLDIGISVIGIGAVVLGLRKAWSLFKGMIDGPDRPYTGKDYSGNDGDEGGWS